MQQGKQEPLAHEIIEAIDQSGQGKATAYSTLWQLFASHVNDRGHCAIILDALDECQNPQYLIQGLKSISRNNSAQVIVTSRKEAHLDKQLNDGLFLYIGPDDVSADIHAFVMAKITKSPRLSNPLVQDLVIQRLSEAHDGMFLWVYLMLKELKACYSITQLRGTLTKLPKGLDGIYNTILERLIQNLRSPQLDLCSKILTLVITAIVGVSRSRPKFRS